MNASCFSLPGHPVLPVSSSDFILREGKVPQAGTNSRLAWGSLLDARMDFRLGAGSLPQPGMKSRLRVRSLHRAGMQSRLRAGSLPKAGMKSVPGAGSRGCLSSDSLLRQGSLPWVRMKSVPGGRTFPWSGMNLFSITGLHLSPRKALKTKALSLPRPARRLAPSR